MPVKQIKTDITREVSPNNKDTSDNIFRPKTFDKYIGQSDFIKALKISITAAKKRNDVLDHILFYGPPGLGKTTLANIIANEMGVNIKTTSAPVIEKQGELAAILNSLNEGDILFIDEIHRLDKNIEEILYSAMEDFNLDIIIGSDMQTKSIRIKLPKFTLIGATTKAGSISTPLRDRFGLTYKMEYYSDEELKKILINSSYNLKLNLKDENILMNLAVRSRGTPRIANRLLKRVRDYAEVNNKGDISLDIIDEALSLLKIDTYGLDLIDKKILTTIIENYKGGPVGISALATSMGEDVGTIEDVYEPYLIQKGLINRTPRGRVASELAYKLLGYPIPET